MKTSYWIITAVCLMAALVIPAAAISEYTFTVGTDTVVVWNGTAGSTSWTVPAGVNNQSIQYVVVAGGGSGGASYTASDGGGGGGAGGVNASTRSDLFGTYTITIGDKGPRTPGTAANGGDSSIGNTIVATGGGKGGNNGVAGSSGGSGGGGGGSQTTSYAGGSGISGQGKAGGTGLAGGSTGTAGGGGGNSTVGQDAPSGKGGNGGNGFTTSIRGASEQMAGGGGGGTQASRTAGTGSYGGGNGGVYGSSQGTDASTPGSGGGGGGNSGNAGGAGAVGIVIVRYATPVAPVASFNQNVTTGTAPTAVLLTDTSTNTPTSWSYGAKNLTPGNNTWFQFSTAQNPNVAFGYGNWSLNLTATNAAGSNISTQVSWLNVSLPAPVASFTMSNTTGYVPGILTLTDTSTNVPSTWYWGAKNLTPGNNTWFRFSTTQNPNAQSFGAGNWSINLTAGNAAGSNISTQVSWFNVTPRPIASFTQSNTTGTAPGIITLTDTSTYGPTSWAWGAKNLTPGNNTWFAFSTAKNPTGQAFGVGNWSLNLTATNPAGSNISTTVNWFNVSNPMATCDFSTTTPLQVNSTAIVFTTTTNALTGAVLNWSWGDGSWTNTTSTGSQSHTYTTSNVYSVSLYVTNPSAVRNVSTRSDYIGIDSMKYYPITDGYVSRTTTAVWATIRGGAGSAVDTSATTNYARVSASTTSNQFSRIDRIIQQYDTSGFNTGMFTPYNISINIYGGSHSNTFSTNPTLDITNCTPASATAIAAADYNTFGASPVAGNNTYASYNDAGYNRMYFNSMGINTANISGLKSYMLRTSWDVYNNQPTWGSSQTGYFLPQTNESSNRPFLLVNFTAATASFTSDKTVGIPGSATIQFTDQTNPAKASWNWSFGDGTYAATQNPSHSYATVGLYNISLQTPYPGGAFANATNYINISAPSFRISSATSGPSPLTVTVNDTSSVITNDNNWIWGDGNQTVGTRNASYTYNTIGTYYIQLQTPSATGDIVTSTVGVNVGIDFPVAAFTANVTSVAQGGYVKFTDQSTGTPTIWQWDFNGTTGTDSTQQSPTVQFNTVGNFSVNLTASTSAGNSSLVKTDYIRVYPSGWYPGIVPVSNPSFTISPFNYTNVNNINTFTGTGSGTIQSVKWNFLDGGTTVQNSTAQTAQYAYTSVGTYSINFTIANAISSASIVVPDYMVVLGPGVPYAHYTIAPTAGTPGVLVSFTDLSLRGTSSGLSYNWSFGDGSYSATPFSSTIGSTAHVYAFAGVYTTSLTITNANGTSTESHPEEIVVSTNQQTQTVFYTPNTVILYLRDSQTMQFVPGLTVTARFNQSTLPATTRSWLITNYGMNTEAANEALNGSLSMSGRTDTTGGCAFMMQPSLQYDISVSDSGGHINNYTLAPRQAGAYYLNFNAGVVAVDNYYDDIVASGNTWSRPYVDPNDLNNFTAMFSFQDLTSLTTKVDFIVTNQNGTILYITNQSNPIAGGVYRVNFTFPNVRGNQITAYQNITRSV